MPNKIKYLLSILDKKNLHTFFIYLLLSIISPALDIFSFSMLLHILNQMLTKIQSSSFMIGLCLCLAVICIGKGLLELYRTRIANRFLYDSMQTLSFRFFDLFLHEELLEHYKKSPMHAVEIIRSDALNSIRIVTDSVSVIIQCCTLTAYAVVLICQTGWMGVISMALLVIWMLLRYHTMRERIDKFGELRRSCLIQTNANITTSFGAYKELRTSRDTIHLQDRFETTSRRHAKIESDFSYMQNLVLVLMRNSVMAAIYLLLVIVLLLQFELSAIVPYLVIYATLMLKLEPISYGIISAMNRIQFSNKSYKVVQETHARYLAYRQRLAAEAKKRKITPSLQEGIEVRNLTFGYPGKKILFENAEISIPAGKTVALIGMSGSGKTTFLDLLLGLLHPQSGSVCFDNYDLVSGTDPEGECTAFLGEIVSYIPQTVYLNGETIRHNVAFMESYDTINEERVIESLKAAHIWDDVCEMPQGLDTLIGEEGVAISGGQRQRIALARTLYKDSALLILDEATAGLDYQTEKAVMDSIFSIKNKTVLLATHHMALADRCDMVYKIENKKIVRVR
ncbi:MAG: ABC transporter ATP-binding protein/permease [Clostridium sp.]|nr:ABC transporter ATP-binding protein/permease [Clostridium sp.]